MKDVRAAYIHLRRCELVLYGTEVELPRDSGSPHRRGTRLDVPASPVVRLMSQA